MIPLNDRYIIPAGISYPYDSYSNYMAKQTAVQIEQTQKMYASGHYAKLSSRCTINILLKFIILYYKNFILPRPKILYVILTRRNDLPEDDILNVETYRSTLFVIIASDIIVQSLVKL